MATDGERLDRFLARRGIGSRRTCARRIADGRVTVNNAGATEPGRRIRPGHDVVLVDGRPVPEQQETRRILLLHKPRGYVCSRSSAEGRSVFDLISGVAERLAPAGRLDKNSEGLLVLSNDGDLIYRLTHPRFQHEKTYRVTVSGPVTDTVLRRLSSRLVLDGYRVQPARVRILRKGAKPGRTILEFVLKEGRKRQIRLLCAAADLTVERLVRTRINQLELSGLKPGQWREATAKDLARLDPGTG